VQIRVRVARTWVAFLADYCFRSYSFTSKCWEGQVCLRVAGIEMKLGSACGSASNKSSLGGLWKGPCPRLWMACEIAHNTTVPCIYWPQVVSHETVIYASRGGAHSHDNNLTQYAHMRHMILHTAMHDMVMVTWLCTQPWQSHTICTHTSHDFGPTRHRAGTSTFWYQCCGCTASLLTKYFARETILF